MAPLSVTGPGGRGRGCPWPRRAPRRGPGAGVRRHPAADEDLLVPSAAAASTALRVSTSQTASWKEAATSATGPGPGLLPGLPHRATAVLSPEEEKSVAVPREVAARGQAAREVDRHRGARPRGPVDVRAAGEGQPEQPGDLVEGLPRRVVDGRAERLHRRGHVGDPQQRGVPAGDQQGQAGVRQRRRARAGRPRRARRGGSRRTAACSSASASALAAATPTSSAPARPGPAVTAIASTSPRRHAGGLAGPLDGRHHRLQVRPRRHLGHDAAEPGVLLDRGGDRVGEQGVAADDADAGLVAGGLDAEDQR